MIISTHSNYKKLHTMIYSGFIYLAIILFFVSFCSLLLFISIIGWSTIFNQLNNHQSVVIINISVLILSTIVCISLLYIVISLLYQYLKISLRERKLDETKRSI